MTNSSIDNEIAAKNGNPKDILGDKKPPLHLIPASANIAESLVMRLGAEKYGPYNWRKCDVRATVYVSAALRHLYQWLDGETLDSESKQSHLAHARACASILIDALELGNLIDDRPEKGPAARIIAGEARKDVNNLESRGKDDSPRDPYLYPQSGDILVNYLCTVTVTDVVTGRAGERVYFSVEDHQDGSSSYLSDESISQWREWCKRTLPIIKKSASHPRDPRVDPQIGDVFNLVGDGNVSRAVVRRKPGTVFYMLVSTETGEKLVDGKIFSQHIDDWREFCGRNKETRRRLDEAL